MTSCGKQVEVFEFDHEDDSKILSKWAKHFREHYCLDANLDALREDTGLTRAEYLTDLIFPDSKEAPGPSTRAGDFAEILVSDYIEFRLNLWVPRTRYNNKVSRNESTKGCDVIGFGLLNSKKSSPDDLLMIVETKAKLSNGNSSKNVIQEAVTHSAKDKLRISVSLNAIKRRLGGDKTLTKRVGRFQNKAENDFKISYGAFAVVNSEYPFSDFLTETKVDEHPDPSGLKLVLIHGKDFMTLTHALYKRSANEA